MQHKMSITLNYMVIETDCDGDERHWEMEVGSVSEFMEWWARYGEKFTDDNWVVAEYERLDDTITPDPWIVNGHFDSKIWGDLHGEP